MRALSRNLLLSACLILPVNAHALDIGVGGENGVNASVGGNGSGGLGVDASVGGS
ncbi:polysaccharide biosynthesis GNAT family N-acetyltransferase UppQ, partial [Rhizobium sp. BR5]